MPILTIPAPAPVIDVLHCSTHPCDVVVANDLGDGWVEVIGTAYLAENTNALHCYNHGGEDWDDHEVDGTFQLTARRF